MTESALQLHEIECDEDQTVLPHPHINVGYTLALLKPDAVNKYCEIEDIILRAKFNILESRRVRLSPEEASEFYAEHSGKVNFADLIKYISSGDMITMLLARENGLPYWLEMMGPQNTFRAKETHPDSLRAIYGRDEMKNALHGSADQEAALREIRFFFPKRILEPIMDGQAASDYMTKVVNTTLCKGLVKLCKIKPEDPVIWLADWLLDNNPFKPGVHPTSNYVQFD